MRFYTNPDSLDRNYPYLLLNMAHRKQLHRHNFQDAIIDSGVLIFQKGTTDYSKLYLSQYPLWAENLQDRYHEKVWITIPDYPDDYHPGMIKNNVEKTLYLIESFFRDYPTINWLPVLQGKDHNPLDFLATIQQFKKLLPNPKRIAIGTICKTNHLRYIEFCLRMTRVHFPDTYIHAFGLTLIAFPSTMKYIDSWDIMAWTKPREPGKPSAKNTQQRREYFQLYLTRIDEITKREAEEK